MLSLYSKRCHCFLAVILCGLFLTGLQACRQKEAAVVPPGVARQLDSLKFLSVHVPADSGLAVQKKISVIARRYGLTDELIRSYCRLSYFIGRTQMDFDAGKTMMDSAASLVKATGSKKMEPVVDLYYATLYNSRDDSLAPYYLEKLTPRLEEMILEDKLIALCAIGNIHAQRGNAAAARKNYLRALALTEKQSPRDFRAEIGLHNNLVILYRQYLKDTLAAVQELHKALNMCTDSIDKLGELEYAYANFAECYIDMGAADSALPLVLKYKKLVDLYYTKREARLIPNTYLAQVAYMKGKYKKADSLLIPFGKYIDSLQLASRSLPTDWYLFKYYEILYKVKKARGDYAAAMKALEDERRFDDLINEKKKNDKLFQYDQNLEKTKMAKALVQQEKQAANIRFVFTLVISLLLLSLSAGIILFFRNKKRLEEQKLKALQQASEIEKKELLLQAETAERKRIAQEFHDELGGSLTIIGMTTWALHQKNIEAIAPQVDTLQRHSKRLTTQMNEIVWSLNDSNDTMGSLMAYVQRYAEQFLEDAGLQRSFNLSLNHEWKKQPIDGYKRRYLFQSVKECLNNIVKHSGATQVKCSAAISLELLTINIEDNGKGMPAEALLIRGNGLNNIRNNIEVIGGRVSWERLSAGTAVSIEVPVMALGQEKMAQ